MINKSVVHETLTSPTTLMLAKGNISMNIYSNTADTYIPYTYLIGWSTLNQFYYGRRTAICCDPNEFWKTYFTSSQHVADFVKEHGEPDIILIRKRFDDISDDIATRIQKCNDWEEKVLRRLDAAKNPVFLNRTNGNGKLGVAGFISVKSITTGKLLSITLEEFHSNRSSYMHHSEGISRDPALVAKLKETLTGAPKSEEHKEKISVSLKAYDRTPEHQTNWTESRRSSPNFKKLCDAIIINGVEYESISEAARKFNLSHSYLCNMLSGRKKLRPDFWEFRKA